MGTHAPEVVREKVSRLTGGSLACVLILDREFSNEELSRFYSLKADARPTPFDFTVSGRVLSYECAESDEAKWRLAAEIFLVKSFRAAAPSRSGREDTRQRFGLRPLHR
jgi:hypothetical protein